MKKTILLIIVMLILAYNVSAGCGDNVCEANEDALNCIKDCPVDLQNAPSCLLDKDKCDSEADYTFLRNALVVIFGIGIFIYLRNKRFI